MINSIAFRVIQGKVTLFKVGDLYSGTRPRSLSAPLRTMMPAYCKGGAEQAILFTVKACNANCAQRIPQRFGAEDVTKMLLAARCR